MRNKLDARVTQLEKKLKINSLQVPELVLRFIGDEPIDHYEIRDNDLEPVIIKRLDNETDDALWIRCKIYMEANRKRDSHYMSIAFSHERGDRVNQQG